VSDRKNAGEGWRFPLPAGVAVVLTALLRFSLYEPVAWPEAAYFFLLPLLLLPVQGLTVRRTLSLGWASGFLFWASSLIWLRHVTLLGTLLLAAVLSLFFAAWYLAYVRVQRRGLPGLTAALLLAALWVVLEWVRGWILWGFPWNPLSVSQASRPAVLAVASVTGGWGLSFLLVWTNLALAGTIRGWAQARPPRRFLALHRAGPYQVLLPVGILLGSAVWTVAAFPGSRAAREGDPVRVGFVQPYSTMLRDGGSPNANLADLWATTRAVAAAGPDLLLWPESATPYPVVGEERMRVAIERLVEEVDRPLLMGNLAFPPGEDYYENAVFLVEPERGLHPRWYAKRELVPFGEFLPFRDWIPFLEKAVAIGEDARPGDGPLLLPFPVPGEGEIGPLVCYEDVFPALARSNVRAGADWLFVATNNVWYGEEAGAPQHAAHAVLRAVETRRPVLRSGIAGWSGWIDEWGVARAVTDAEGSIYFRGGEVLPVRRDPRFAGVLTPYVRYGDWFVGACGLLLLGGLLRLRLAGRRAGEATAPRE